MSGGKAVVFPVVLPLNNSCTRVQYGIEGQYPECGEFERRKRDKACESRLWKGWCGLQDPARGVDG